MWPAMMRTLLLTCLVVAGAAAMDDMKLVEKKATLGEDPCQSAGSFCGSFKCLPRGDHESFACDCGKRRYFNAAAQRCFHIFSCSPRRCNRSQCVDDGGNSAAKCVCQEGPHITKDCQENITYTSECIALGGKLQQEKSGDETVMPHCVCRPGTLLSNGVCVSIACLFPNLTCQDICRDTKLSEDTRCCQGWSAASCNESLLTEPYCKPGSVWNLAESRCESACYAGLSKPLCKHGCHPVDLIAANYTCNCSDGEELSADGLTCTVKTKCNDDEQQDCAKKGRQCAIEAGKPRCRCHEKSIELADSCLSTCTETKTQECSTPFSWCVLKDYTETCVCLPPLRWNYTSRQCMPEEEYKYTVDFRENHYKMEEDSPLIRCTGPEMEEDVHHAMKNLYGSDLIGIKVISCGSFQFRFHHCKRETVTTELTFAREPPSSVLNMVRLCEVPLGATTCLFPPLRIVKGSVSGPVPVDLCSHYFQNISKFSAGVYYCTNEDGHCMLRCSSGNVTESIHRGFLELQTCRRAAQYTGEGTDKMWKLGAIVGVSLAVLFSVAFAAALAVLIFRKRYCYYRPPPEDPKCREVKFKARPASQRYSSHEQDATAHLLTPISNERTETPQGTEHEAAAARTGCH